MTLKNLLIRKKNNVVKKWLDRVLETYPVEAQRVFRQQNDPFSNPVGSTIFRSLEGLYDELPGPADYGKVRSLLDGVVRIRAIQDFSPSQAVIFLPLLKGILKEEIGEEVRQSRLHDDWLELESRIDEFLLLAFDIYMDCREKVLQLKAAERQTRPARSSPRSDT
jgi:hypothetical protein